MNEFNVYIPVLDQRDALVSHFTSSDTIYVIPIETFIASADGYSAPSDASDSEICELGRSFAEDILWTVARWDDETYEVDEVEGPYEVTDKNGNLLGWNVTAHVVASE